MKTVRILKPGFIIFFQVLSMAQKSTSPKKGAAGTSGGKKHAYLFKGKIPDEFGEFFRDLFKTAKIAKLRLWNG